MLFVDWQYTAVPGRKTDVILMSAILQVEAAMTSCLKPNLICRIKSVSEAQKVARGMYNETRSISQLFKVALGPQIDRTVLSWVLTDVIFRKKDCTEACVVAGGAGDMLCNSARVCGRVPRVLFCAVAVMVEPWCFF